MRALSVRWVVVYTVAEDSGWRHGRCARDAWPAMKAEFERRGLVFVAALQKVPA